MMLWTIIHTDPKYNNIERVVNILKTEFGLVKANNSDITDREILVWEDKNGVGRYRVHIFSNEYRLLLKRNVDSFSFQYWSGHRLTREIVELDPIKLAIERTKNIIVGEYIEEIRREKSIYYILNRLTYR